MSGVASILLVSRFNKSDTTLNSPRRPVRSCSIRSDWELCVRSRPVWVVDLSHARSRYFVFMSRRDSRPIALANAPSPNHWIWLPMENTNQMISVGLIVDQIIRCIIGSKSYRKSSGVAISAARTLLWFLSQMIKLCRARSLVYRRQILQENVRWRKLLTRSTRFACFCTAQTSIFQKKIRKKESRKKKNENAYLLEGK